MPRPFSRIPGEALFFCLLTLLPAAASAQLPVPTSTAIGGPRAPLPALTGIDRNIMSIQANQYVKAAGQEAHISFTLNTANLERDNKSKLVATLKDQANMLLTLLTNLSSALRNPPPNNGSRNRHAGVLAVVQPLIVVGDTAALVVDDIGQADKLLQTLPAPDVYRGNLYFGSRVAGREGHTTTAIPDIIFGDAVAGYDASLQEYVDGSPGTGGSVKYAFGRERAAYSAALAAVLTDTMKTRWLRTQPRALLHALKVAQSKLDQAKSDMENAVSPSDKDEAEEEYLERVRKYAEVIARLKDFTPKFQQYLLDLQDNAEKDSDALRATLVHYARAPQSSVYVTGRSYIGAGDFTGEGITVGQLLPVGKGGVTASLLAQAVQFSASGAGGTHPSGVQSGLVLVWQEQASNFDAAQKPIIHYWHYKIGAEYFTPALGQPETFDVFFRLRLLPSYLEFTPYYVFPQHNVKSYPGINFGITVPVSF